MSKRTIPVCFTRDQLKRLEEYGKSSGTLNASQALEKLINDS